MSNLNYYTTIILTAPFSGGEQSPILAQKGIKRAPQILDLTTNTSDLIYVTYIHTIKNTYRHVHVHLIKP